jgi:hypothetical protein
MKKNLKLVLTLILLVVLLVAWAPWLNDKEIHDRVFQERAQKDGTMGWVIYLDGSKKYELICDYTVMWVPFGRWVASCEGGYYVTFWGQILP